jgi:hypothetical protein
VAVALSAALTAALGTACSPPVLPTVPEGIIGVPGSFTFTQGYYLGNQWHPAGGTVIFCVDSHTQLLVGFGGGELPQHSVVFDGITYSGVGSIITPPLGPGCGTITSFEDDSYTQTSTVTVAKYVP